MRALLAVIIGTSTLFAAAAHAGTVYSYEVSNPRQNDTAGVVNKVSVDYDTDDVLSFAAAFTANNGLLPQAGWFVLSPGQYPRLSGNELAILYLDFAGGDVYAYRYNGVAGTYAHGRETYLDEGNFITSYEDVLSVDYSGDASSKLSIGFDNLDVSALSPGTFGDEWTGVSYGPGFGGWFHFTTMDSYSISNGKISGWYPKWQSWYDVDGKTATVPEPATLAGLALFGVVGLGLYRRNRRGAAKA
ncbi:PEP-CTERM sorting domain-containing protein [Parvularcula sp. LCG005]|uniref:PEP-CTERM sorting domain-containing protein n=1 Tax=Parvularcula sp. LCG005 TaxID=3078805 RepID=UPI00294307A2|nr:PEP-CTERM sorting domain-containing protein [Parvularcula sp. LCG005]WOI54077.1 PEP-CTERM sorting domain-containing protein [Parvularcula sp. LCG005]